MEKKKLIEVALPLEAINVASAREKSIRHGHPSTLHLWWSRKPTATARAVIWSSLVDDPSSHLEQFPTEETQEKERERLFKILTDLVQWENSNNEQVLAAARAEIMRSTGGNPPPLLDPFAGGGSIPLEAQRLGLEAHASDLNPVAVMINKAMIEIPPRFAGMPPVNPEARRRMDYSAQWKGAQGLADDVRYYGEWMKQEAFKRIGHLYPKVQVPKEQGGGEATVIAWKWARTVKCPNPACGSEMPLASSFVLSKKAGNESYIEPILDYGKKEIHYCVKTGSPRNDITAKTSRGANFKCLVCGEPVTADYIKQEAAEGRMHSVMMAVVAEGKSGRIYISPDELQRNVALTSKPIWYPDQALPYDPRNIWCVSYGLDTYDKLFTPRQLTALTTFSDLVAEAQTRAEADAIAAGMADDGVPLVDGGSGAKAYGQAVGVYLTFLISKSADRNSSICSWDTSREGVRNTFGRQAIPMVWDFAESNPFSNSSGCWDNSIEWIYKCLEQFPAFSSGIALQFDAQSDNGMRDIMLSTDPPYYDNIGYADLSDFFYVWMRQALKGTYPKLFRTMLVPKAEELIATPYRFDGSTEKARDFFEDGMLNACRQIYIYARKDVPVTIYYAYKQSDTDDDDDGSQQTASTGWETMLSAVIQAGFTITGTWPIRTEMINRATSLDNNSLASSVVLVCRKRPADAPVCTRRDLVATLKRELRPALAELQRANIAPVDLAQSAIGPGIGVYSRYSKVLEADGSPMSVRTALAIINQELDSYFTEQEGALDGESRFCAGLYTQQAFNSMKFGEADVLARAKNTSVDRMAARGMLVAERGSVRLLTREELPAHFDMRTPALWLLTQQLTHAMETGGVESCAKLLIEADDALGAQAKALAYRLYTIAERKGWAQEAFAYNSLVVAWPDIQSKAAELRSQKPKQGKLFD
ncbi:MAG: DUF1156 domain-containing protein [Clostridiales bacterium]|nr:DUF1156 domain-containing protein [Clostridiales bacterium]